MTNLNRPKKNPDMVRHRLLQSTASLMTTHGFAGVSIDKVATEAGVTKG
ncbi:TetR/AcrR family transcriptional regulator, partial [Psychrobacter sp. TB20-MNA-CIBAN-0197]